MTGRSVAVVILSALFALAGRQRDGLAAEPATNPVAEGAPETPAQLFRPTRIWTVHLRFAAEQWAAMEPKPGRSVLGLLFGGRRNQTPPADLLAGTMLKRGDRSHDGKLDRQELVGLADEWIARWDYAKAGKLDPDKLRDGLNAMLDPEGVERGGTFPFSLRGESGKRNGLATALGIEFVYVHADLEFQDAAMENVAVRYKGNGTFADSRNSIKRPLKLDLNQFVGGQRLAGLSKINLHNNITDASSMIEPLSFRLYRDAGVPAPRTAYARVYVTVPAKYDRRYFGLYSIVENVDDAFAKDRFGTKKGALFKPVTPSLFADLGEDWADYAQTYDPKTEVSAAQARRVIDFSRLLTYAGDAEFAARVGDYLDIDQFARFMAVTVYLSALDSILMVGQNYYLYLHPETGKFIFIPWDQDHSFGQIFGDQQQLERLSLNRPWVGPNRFLERIFKVEAFKKQYLARLDEFGGTIFKPDRIQGQMNEFAAAIRPAIELESKGKAAHLDKAISAEPVKATGGFFSSRPPNSIGRFAGARTPSIVDQLANKTEGHQPGGVGFGAGRVGPGPGEAIAPHLLATMDTNRDGSLDRKELERGFGKWFDAWDIDKSGVLTDDRIRAGTRKELSAPRPATRPATRPQE